MEEVLNCIKKYGLTSVLAIAYLAQSYSLNNERKETQYAMKKLTEDSITILYAMDKRLCNLEEELKQLKIETKENRYELRVLGDTLNVKQARRTTE